MCSCPSEHSAHSAAKTAPATRRGARPSRQAGAVFAQYPSSRRTAVARSGAVFAEYPSSRRTAVAQSGAVFAQYRLRRTAVARSGAVFAQYPSSRRTAVARRRCCVCTVSFVAAHGRRAKRCCVCTVSFVAVHGCRAKEVLCLHSIGRGTRPLRSQCWFAQYPSPRNAAIAAAVFAQYRSRSTAIARNKCCVCPVSFVRRGARPLREGGAVFAQYPSWRRTAIGRRRCCVCTVSFVAAHGDRAKAVLCSHSILRGGARSSGEGGAVFARLLHSFF